MARTLSYMKAINEALAQEMDRDPSVVVFGEDVAGGAGTSQPMDAWGGVFGLTKGLWEKFPDRVLDTPISESAIMGAAAGAAVSGLRPVAELMFIDFLGVCFDQIFNQAAKFRYMFGGKTRTPMVIRTCYGAGAGAAAQHSQTLYNIFTNIPGLKVVVPSSPYDAKGLLTAAIRDDDPVIFCEHKALYGVRGEVPTELYEVPLGQANVVREGTDVTVVALGQMVPRAQRAAEALQGEGVGVEVVDPRTTSPLDEATILASVTRTGRCVVVDEGYPRCGMGTDLVSLVATRGPRLRAPIGLVTPPHTPVPFAHVLEEAYLPGPDEIAAAVRTTLEPVDA